MPDDLAFPKTPRREYPETTERKPLTRRQFAELILAQEGRCGCGCGERLKADEIVDEHLHALSLGGGNELTNRALWRKQCSAKKTAKRDRPADAKGKRLRGEVSTQASRREARGSSIKSPADPWKRPEGYVSALSRKSKFYRKRGIGQ